MYNGFTPPDKQFAGPSRNLGREIGGGGNVADRPERACRQSWQYGKVNLQIIN
jgi:hypothetical protein